MIKKLFVDQDVADTPAAASFGSQLNLAPVIVEGAHPVYSFVQRSSDPVQTGKETLYLTRNKGPFIRKCPGTRSYLCCDYMILHVGSYCTMDCAYCILQSYFHPPVLQYFVNDQALKAELKDLFGLERLTRIGTGEFTDSLIWERWTDRAADLVSLFARQDRAVLELKTKTAHVSRLLPLAHQGKTIMAWSLNTESVIRRQERGTASLKARLSAAARCQAHGYPVAFHFDPIILYENCEQDYQAVLKRLFDMISPQNIVWISLGTFRFMPALKTIIQDRFRDSKIVYGEFIPGLDGKMRYFKPLRIQIYREMVAWIRTLAPDVCVYLCMEDEEVWQQAFGFEPADRGGLARMLDQAALQHCSLNPSLMKT